jgi:hypothetical protein
MKQIELDSSALVCPGCKERCLHQKKVSVFWRDHEDSLTGKFVSSSPEGSAVEPFLVGIHRIPSPRRDGLTIDFDCEICEAEPRLKIYQHKGTTYIEWESFRQSL